MSDVLVQPGSAEALTIRETREVVVLTEQEDVSITWSRYQARESGADPHVHRDHTDCFYVLEGELAMTVGPDLERISLPAGGFIAAPPGLVHGFDNDSDAEVRYLNFHAPDSGFIRSMRARRDGGDPSWDSFDPPADGGLPRSEAIIRLPGEGERLAARTRVVHMKVAVPHVSLGEWRIDGPMEGPSVHRHDTGVDSFYVIHGELEMTVEGEVHTAGAHTLASVPRGVLHTFNHPSSGTTRMLNVHTPDEGFADFLRSVSD